MAAQKKSKTKSHVKKSTHTKKSVKKQEATKEPSIIPEIPSEADTPVKTVGVAEQSAAVASLSPTQQPSPEESKTNIETPSPTSEPQKESGEPARQWIETSTGKKIVMPQPESAGGQTDVVSPLPQQTIAGPAIDETTSKEELSSDEIDKPSIKKKIFVISGLLFIFLVFLAGIFLYIRQLSLERKNNQPAVSQKPAPIPPTETPVVTSEAQLQKYAIKVLNGSGIRGEAAKAKDLLESDKFKVTTIGNADTSDFEETVVQASKSVSKEYLDQLKKTLSKVYKVGEVGQLPKEETEADVIVIVGSKTSN